MNRYKFTEEKKTKLGKRYFSSIMYTEIKTNNDDGTDSFGRLLECKLRFRWKNMTNGVKAGKFQGFVKIIVLCNKVSFTIYFNN